MKYMTKEWYETMQKTNLHLSLKVSKKAETFSENFFKELYKREEKKYLKFQKEVAEVKFEDIYPEEFEAKNIDGSPLEKSEFEELKKEYLEQRENAKLEFEKMPPFDIEQEKKHFKRLLKINISNLKDLLPESILTKVADIRVLALDYASSEVKKEISAYCKKNNKIVCSIMKSYQKQYNKQFKSNVPSFVSALDLHDCEVLSCQKRGKNIVMTINNSGGFTNINKILMKNCSVIKQDAPLYGARFLYEEIYKTGEKYEIHFLLQKNELIDFIVLVDNLEYKYS